MYITIDTAKYMISLPTSVYKLDVRMNLCSLNFVFPECQTCSSPKPRSCFTTSSTCSTRPLTPHTLPPLRLSPAPGPYGSPYFSFSLLFHPLLPWMRNILQRPILHPSNHRAFHGLPMTTTFTTRANEFQNVALFHTAIGNTAMGNITLFSSTHHADSPTAKKRVRKIMAPLFFLAALWRIILPMYLPPKSRETSTWAFTYLFIRSVEERANCKNVTIFSHSLMVPNSDLKIGWDIPTIVLPTKNVVTIYELLRTLQQPLLILPAAMSHLQLCAKLYVPLQDPPPHPLLLTSKPSKMFPSL